MAFGIFAAAPASAQQFTIKMSQPTINDVVHEYYKAIKAGVEQRSGGRIKVDIYPANQLGQLPAVVEGVALGTIEVGSAANGFWVSLEPRFAILDAPGLFDDVLHGYRMLTDPEIRARLATFGADKGVEVLTPGIYAPLMLLSHKAVRAVADFRGQKIRTQGGAPIQVEPLKKVGVLPVSLPLGEALPAMQNRTIDGMVAAATPFVAFKYYDIAKPMTYLPRRSLPRRSWPIGNSSSHSGPSLRPYSVKKHARRKCCSRTGTSRTSSAPRTSGARTAARSSCCRRTNPSVTSTS